MSKVRGARVRDWHYRQQRNRKRWELIVIVMDTRIYSMTVMGIKTKSCWSCPPLRLWVISQISHSCKLHYPQSENYQYSYPEHRIQQQGKHDEFQAQEQQLPYSGRNPSRSQPINCSHFTMSNTTPHATQPTTGAFGFFDSRCCFHRFTSSEDYRFSFFDQSDRLAATRLFQSSGGLPFLSIFSNTA